MKQEQILRKVLEENSSKITKPRLIVFKLLQEHGLQSLSELIKHADKKIDRVSIYRTIELFSELGIIRKVNIGWKYKVELSEIFLDHHHHVTCLGCSKVIAVREDIAMEDLISNLVKPTDFTVVSHQLELQGYCGNCKQAQPA